MFKTDSMVVEPLFWDDEVSLVLRLWLRRCPSSEVSMVSVGVIVTGSRVSLLATNASLAEQHLVATRTTELKPKRKPTKPSQATVREKCSWTQGLPLQYKLYALARIRFLKTRREFRNADCNVCVPCRTRFTATNERHIEPQAEIANRKSAAYCEMDNGLETTKVSTLTLSLTVVKTGVRAFSSFCVMPDST